MVLPPMESRSIGVGIVGGKAAITQALLPIRKNGKKKSFVPIKNAVVCADWNGRSVHVERFNNILRQRLARFVRKTLSLSKSQLMHEICLRLFIWRYNMDIYARYLQELDM